MISILSIPDWSSGLPDHFLQCTDVNGIYSFAGNDKCTRGESRHTVYNSYILYKVTWDCGGSLTKFKLFIVVFYDRKLNCTVRASV